MTEESSETKRSCIFKTNDLCMIAGLEEDRQSFKSVKDVNADYVVPTTPYMRCSLPEKSNMEDWDWSEGVYSQTKADGMFANVNVRGDGYVWVTSRGGTLFPVGCLGLEDEIAATFGVRMTLNEALNGWGLEQIKVASGGISTPVSIANGGTNSATALSGNSIMISDGTHIVQGTAGTTTTVLHGNAAGSPTYAAVSLTADVSGQLPIANGGTASNTAAGALSNLGGAASAQASWTAVTYKNSWADFGGGFYGVAYMKDTIGFVHLRGIMKSGTLASAAFTLPAGYQPTSTISQIVGSNSAAGFYSINTSGDFLPSAGSSNTSFSCDGIIFWPG